MKLPAMIAGFPNGAPSFVDVLVNVGVGGGSVGSGTNGTAGGVVETPSAAEKALATIVTPPGVSPVLRARTVIAPGERVARIATRLIPASRSRNGWLMESIFPLLYPPRHTPGPSVSKSTRC